MFVVTKQIDGDNISKLCRTCLREDGEKMVCLFVGPAGSSLAAKLRSLSCLEVWQGDGLPEKLCDRCVTRAESALLFREQCRTADRALRQAASKVSGLTTFTTVSGCKLYQQNQGLTPIENSQKTLKCVECGAVFMDYQELCAHSRLHTPFIQEPPSLQHMHIVESNNSYFTADSSLSESVADDTQSGSMPPETPTEKDRPACALYCSICNHTFLNRNQLISHNLSHGDDDVAISCENNVEIDDDSVQITDNLDFQESAELTYRPTEPDVISFSEELVIDTQQTETEDSIIQSKSISSDDNSIGISNHPIIPFPQFSEEVGQDQPNSSTFSPEKKHECSVCGKLFSQKSKLITHEFSHSGHKPFKCKDCDKAYTSKSKLNAHIRLHTGTNLHQCKICDKTFSFLSYLTEHAKIHRPGRLGSKSPSKTKEFQCSTCNKQYRLKKNLIAHLRLHSGKNLLHCGICDKSFSQKYNLKAHLRTHKSTKLHKCEFCSKSFGEKGNYREHLRIHTKIKPFSCKICGNSFSQSSHLRNHEVTHNSLRPHQCRLCGKTFKLLSHMKRHMSLHSTVKSFKCDQCDQMFTQAFSLKRHLKKHSEA